MEEIQSLIKLVTLVSYVITATLFIVTIALVIIIGLLRSINKKLKVIEEDYYYEEEEKT